MVLGSVSSEETTGKAQALRSGVVPYQLAQSARREFNIGPGSEERKGRSVCCDLCPAGRATTRQVSPIAVMVMIVATMIVIVAVVIISAMHTPMNSTVVAIVGLRLVHG
jgi:hypothetical protein